MGTKKGTKPRKWSKEEKLKIVRLHLNENKSLMEIEREYSVSNGLVSTWVKKYLDGGEEALVSHSGNPYAALHTSKSLSEVERLRLIVAKQEIEIARLKKGYWVEGVGANKEYVTGSGKNTKSSKNSKQRLSLSELQTQVLKKAIHTTFILQKKLLTIQEIFKVRRVEPNTP